MKRRSVRRLASPSARSRTAGRSDGADEALAKAFRALAEADLSGDRPSPAVRRAVIEQFHRLYYHSHKQTWMNTRFQGVTVWKNPMDLWLYQEMIHEFRPDVIIEAGTKYGGSAYYFARLSTSSATDRSSRSTRRPSPTARSTRGSPTSPDHP